MNKHQKSRRDSAHFSYESLQPVLQDGPAVLFAAVREDDRLRVVWVTPNLERMCGHTAEAAMQPRWWESHIHPDDRAAADAHNRRIMELGETTAEFRFRHADGSWRVIHSHVRRIDADAIGEYVIAWTDVTERAAAERALQESSVMIRQLTDNIHDAIWLSDVHSRRVCYMNPACGRIWGDRVDPATGEPTGWLARIHELDRTRVEAAIERAYTGMHEFDERYRIVEPDGDVRWVHDRAFPVRDVEGRLVRLAGITRDVTDRKRMEDELREAQRDLEQRVVERTAELNRTNDLLREQMAVLETTGRRLSEAEGRYRSLVESACDMIAVHREGRFLYVNAAGARLLGLPDAAAAVGLQTADFFEARDEGHPAAVGVGVVHEQRVTRADGSVREVETVSNTILFGGEPAIQMACRDVTRRNAERRLLRQAEERFRRIFERNTAVKFIIDPIDGRIVDANPAAARFYGYPLDRLRGMLITDINTLDPKRVMAAVQRSAAEQVSYVSFPHRLASGEVRMVEVHAGPVDLDGRSLIYSIITDVTAREHAQEELSESERRFRGTFEQAAVGIAHVDLNGQFLRVNRRLGEITGYDPAELHSMNFHEVTHPDDLGTDVAHMQQLLTGELDSYSLEKRYIRPDGEPVWTFLTRSLMRDSAGKPEYFVTIVEEISARKQAEEALARTEEQFRQAQKLEAVGRLAGGIAHDLNNVMTAITGYTQFALDELGPGHPVHPDMREVLDGADRASALVRQLLAFSRRQIQKPELLDVNEVVSGVQRLVRRMIGEDVGIATTLSEAVGPVLADRSQLEQVLLNLIVNARDAMPDGGRIVLRTQNTEIQEDYTRERPLMQPGSYVMLSVTDTGTGMSHDVQERIFEPFFTTKEPGKGTGLGLAVVYGIVRQSGGFVWVYSEPGQGTSFKIYLPRAEGVPEPTAERAEAAPVVGGSEVVLLVEDDPSVRRLSQRVLERAGYNVLTADGGEAGLAIATAHEGSIDLLLTDVVMPGMGGRELAERVSQLRPGTRVMFASGYAEDEIAHRGLIDPHVAFIEKPFTPDGLVRSVREALSARAKDTRAPD